MIKTILGILGIALICCALTLVIILIISLILKIRKDGWDAF